MPDRPASGAFPVAAPSRKPSPTENEPFTDDAGNVVYPCADGCGRFVAVTPTQASRNGGETRWFLVEHRPADEPRALTGSEYQAPEGSSTR